MINYPFQKRWTKIWISLLLALFVLAVDEPTSAASEEPEQASSAALYYELAIQAEQISDYVSAGIYLQLYRQLNPPEYARNTNNQKNIVDARIQFYIDQTKYLVFLEKTVKNDLNACQHFPCSQSSLTAIHAESPRQPLPSLPNTAILCTGRNYTGICKVLAVGEYTNFTQMNINDQISSVMVGSQVKLLLYRHSRFDSEFTILTSSDPDLRDNWLTSTTSWNDLSSAAKVQYK